MDKALYDQMRETRMRLIEEKHVLALRIREITEMITALQHALDKAEEEGIADV